MEEQRPLLIMMVGRPRSGKSTTVKKLLEVYKAPVVSADCLRLATYGERWRQEAEDLIYAMEKIFVRSLFLAGHKLVILDETNTTKARRDRYSSKDWDRCFILVTTPLDECVRRAIATNQPALAAAIPVKYATIEVPGADEGPMLSDLQRDQGSPAYYKIAHRDDLNEQVEIAAKAMELKQRSGFTSSNSTLVSFLYELMRDHVPPGKIEKTMNNTPNNGISTIFTNGWLAAYAADVADRLEKSK